MHKCEKMNYFLNESKGKIILYVDIFDEYGIPIPDGGTSYVKINYCPWCGKRLPDSKRDQWFDELEKLGFEDPFSDEVPEEYHSAKWYQSQDSSHEE